MRLYVCKDLVCVTRAILHRKSLIVLVKDVGRYVVQHRTHVQDTVISAECDEY